MSFMIHVYRGFSDNVGVCILRDGKLIYSDGGPIICHNPKCSSDILEAISKLEGVSAKCVKPTEGSTKTLKKNPGVPLALLMGEHI